MSIANRRSKTPTRRVCLVPLERRLSGIVYMEIQLEQFFTSVDMDPAALIKAVELDNNGMIPNLQQQPTIRNCKSAPNPNNTILDPDV
uniref:CUE domain-containing protein n=1 Tax=Rhabditophanes sp. KR3021 TaxID=114890 RepID=A0AC35TK83_9BILA